MPIWKFVPARVKVTVEFWKPVTGEIDVIVGVFCCGTVNTMGVVLVLPLTVVTLTNHLPNAASAGTVKFPVIAVDVTLVSVAVRVTNRSG